MVELIRLMQMAILRMIVILELRSSLIDPNGDHQNSCAIDVLVIIFTNTSSVLRGSRISRSIAVRRLIILLMKRKQKQLRSCVALSCEDLLDHFPHSISESRILFYDSRSAAKIILLLCGVEWG